MVSDLGEVLIAGAGPAAIQVAVSLSNSGFGRKVGLANRLSFRTRRLMKELSEKNREFSVKVLRPSLSKFSGKARLTDLFSGYQSITGRWETLVLCVPSDSYLSVLKEVPPLTLKQLKNVLLISPGMGSNYLVDGFFKKLENDPEIISLSTYIGDTKFSEEELSLTEVTTKAIKKRVYLASNQPAGRGLQTVMEFFESLGLKCSALTSPLEAESRSITIYVHPPYLMSDFALDVIFQNTRAKKFTYKLFPEGPITPASIHDMLNVWKEVSALLTALHLAPFNLLKFLNDDNYPVREESLSREDIENFCDLGQTKQEYLLYIRYASLLIDPFSEPDENGRYLEFSSNPFRLSYQDENEKWIIPRIPTEDYKRMKLIKGMAEHCRLKTPTIEKLIGNFEAKSRAFMMEKGPENMAENLHYDETEELAIICSQLNGLCSGSPL